MAIHRAVVAGDIDALREAYGDESTFPNCQGPLAIGDSILIYAIYHGPNSLVINLLALGAAARPDVSDGFPPMVALMSTQREDKHELIQTLADAGANVDEPGVNDQTALSWAIGQGDAEGVRLLLLLGADPHRRTRIDDRTSPLDEAEVRAATTGDRMILQLLTTAERR